MFCQCFLMMKLRVALYTHLKIGKDIRLTKAPPQGQAMNGLAERSVRTLKEQFLTISEELKGEGVSICDTGNAIGSVFTYVCFMLNSHASVHGTKDHLRSFWLVRVSVH